MKEANSPFIYHGRTVCWITVRYPALAPRVSEHFPRFRFDLVHISLFRFIPHPSSQFQIRTDLSSCTGCLAAMQMIETSFLVFCSAHTYRSHIRRMRKSQLDLYEVLGSSEARWREDPGHRSACSVAA